jgi:endonuclease-3
MNILEVMDILESRYVPRRRPTLRRTSEEEPNPFKILIACLLSLRTTDINTERASSKLFKVASTPQEIASMHTEKLEELIYSSGHYRKKAQVLKSVSKELINRFDSKVPSTKEELLSIKGIGPKTANIVLAFAYGQEVLPIDTHCHRIPNRLGWVNTKTPEKTEKELEKVLPKQYWKEFNTVIILFGKEICQPISPWCSKCPIKHCPQSGVIRSR